MLLLYKYNVTKNHGTKQSINSIISEVKGIYHQDAITKIRNAASSDIQRELKLQLPSFYPTLESKSPLTPTGLIQIDIDVKDNPTLSIDEVKSLIIDDPHCFYAFYSPSGGLKAAFNSDFKAMPNESDESITTRFKDVFNHLIVHIKDSIPQLVFDMSVASISQQCFISYDPDVYFNEHADELSMNDISIAEKIVNASHWNVSKQSVSSIEFVEELLSYIPKDLTYMGRRNVNYAVFGSLDESDAFNVLLGHWSKEINNIESQLNEFCKHKKYGSIGHLVNIAKKYGYKTKTGRQRKSLKPTKGKPLADNLLGKDDATNLLKSHVSDFFTNKKSMFINASVGIGKTRVIIEKILELSADTNVLILVKSYELAYQIKRDIENAIIRKILEAKTIVDKSKIKSRVHVIEGRKQPINREHSDSNKLLMCEYKITINGKAKNITDFKHFPKDVCTKECPWMNQCEYIEQFNDNSNIRIATHNDYYNEPSYWSSGTKIRKHYINYADANGYGEVGIETLKLKDGKRCWTADYIIVDEDIIEIKNSKPIIETSNSDFESINNIIYDLSNGIPLEQAIKNQSGFILADSEKNSKYPKVNYKNIEQYMADVKKANEQFKYSEILDFFKCFLEQPEDNDLRHVLFDGTELKLKVPSKMHSRHKNTPILYLDATGNEKIVKSIYGDIDYRKISVKTNDEVNIYQLSNSCVTKSYFIEHGLDVMLTGLKKLIVEGEYKNVGLISYMNIDELQLGASFVGYIANQLSITIYSHFGNLRGLNKFENVDCLIILGRHSLHGDDTFKYANYIFGSKFRNSEKAYLNLPVRMKSGETMIVNSSSYSDVELNSVYEHFSIAETIQAIGRGRYVHGSKKDIFLFSNESIGTDIEVTDFIEWDDYFEPRIIQDNFAEKLHEIGFIKRTAGEIAKAFKKCGFETKGDLRTYVGNHYKKICKELTEAGFKLCTYLIKNSNSQTRTNEYFVFENDEKLRRYLLEQGDKNIKNLVE